MKHYLVVKEVQTDTLVRTIDVSDQSPAQRQRALQGLLRNMDRDKFYVDETSSDPASKPEVCGFALGSGRYTKPKGCQKAVWKDGYCRAHHPDTRAERELHRRSPRRVADKEFQDVRQMHLKFNLGVGDAPSASGMQPLAERLNFLLEELLEAGEAAGLHLLDHPTDGLTFCPFTDPKPVNLPGVADALVDLVVVAKGTGVQLALPWEALWDDVHRANMAKERGVGPRGHAVDLVKPEGWVGPKTEEILRKHGWKG